MLAKKFLERNVPPAIIESFGEKMILRAMGSSCSTLNEERYNTYIKRTAVSEKKVESKNFKPTTDSAGLHCLRVYLQVQSWDGIELDPLQWGFAKRGRFLLPVKMRKPPAQESLLKVVRCGCRSGCERMSCSCRKYGLPCGAMCNPCRGTSCMNRMEDDSTN